MLHERFAERFEDWLGLIRDHHTVLRLDRARAGSRPTTRATASSATPTPGSSTTRSLVDGVTIDDDLYSTETFGPIVGVATFRDFDEAMELANGHGYGLSSSIYTPLRRERVPLPRAHHRRHGVGQQLDVRRRGAPAVRRQRQVRQRLAPVGHLGARPVHPLAVDELGLRRASSRRPRWTSSSSTPTRTSGSTRDELRLRDQPRGRLPPPTSRSWPAGARGLGPDRRRLACRAGDGAGVKIDREVALAQTAGFDCPGRQRCEHVDVTFGEFGADRPGPVGGVARALVPAVGARVGHR